MTDLYNIFVETVSGRILFPTHPDPESITIEDIAHHLSLINRYNGATVRPYSVAEHSINLAAWAQYFNPDPDLVLNYLLHDSAEAYLQDIIRPLHAWAAELRGLHAILTPVIHQALGVPYLGGLNKSELKRADMAISLDERRALMPAHRASVVWGDIDDLDPLGIPIDGPQSYHDWSDIKGMFLEYFRRLMAQKRGLENDGIN
jgi:hypothetical protein